MAWYYDGYYDIIVLTLGQVLEDQPASIWAGIVIRPRFIHMILVSNRDQ